jgi:predicted amino acid racemase
MENSRLLEQCKRLKNERKEWMSRLKSRGIKLVGSQQGLAGDTEEAPGSRNQQISIVIEERINELERLIGEYREENSTLKCELRQIQAILLFGESGSR